MKINELLNKLVERQDLNLKEAEDLIDQMAQGQLQPTQMASFLTALRLKEESVDEITGFIKGMRKHMITLDHPVKALDIVGTGGDGLGSFNISTASALVVAGAGVKVAKHGNRAASSKCGSADVLESLGVNINLTPQAAEAILQKVGLVFLFAPLYHPAMKIIGPVRKDLGFRTVFNFLGPFLNPAQVKYQLLGVPNLKTGKKLIAVAQKLNYQHLLIVVSKDGMDEISLSGLTYAFEIKNGKIKNFTINPQKFGFKKAPIKEILGSGPKENAQIILNLLNKKPGPKRDIVILNSAFALTVAGKAKDVKEGIRLSQQSIDSGAAKQILQNLIKESQLYA